MTRRYGGVKCLKAACRQLGASDLDPGAAFSGHRPERAGSSEGEGGVNLGDGGPYSGARLPISLPEVLVSPFCEFLSPGFRVIRRC